VVPALELVHDLDASELCPEEVDFVDLLLVVQQPPEAVLKQSPDHLGVVALAHEALVDGVLHLRLLLLHDHVVVLVQHLAEVVEKLLLQGPPVVLGPEELLVDVLLAQPRDVELLREGQDGGHVELPLRAEGLLHERVVQLEHLVDGVLLVLLRLNLVDQDLGGRVLVFLLLLTTLVHHLYLHFPLRSWFLFFMEGGGFLGGETAC